MGDALFRLAVDLLHTQFPPRPPVPGREVLETSPPTVRAPSVPNGGDSGHVFVAGIDLNDPCGCCKCAEQRARALLELEARR